MHVNNTVVHLRLAIGSLTGALVQEARGRIDNQKEKKRYGHAPRDAANSTPSNLFTKQISARRYVVREC